ncbi:MAG: hypothetical protein H7328_03495 [Bdellovibrio sp.]|nr:hypothetical protein [Bdellovibrio sp.]
MKTNPFKLFLPLLALPPLFFGCASKATRDYETTEITLGKADFQVRISKYSADKPSKKSLLIMPPTGGTNFIDRSYARRFSKSGYDVYILDGWSGMNEQATDLELHQRLYTNAQKAIRIVLDHIKSPYIGLLGTSVGALHGAVAASTQDRINSVFIIVGGAPIAEVIITSDQKAMVELKKARKERYQFKTDEEYRLALDKAFQLEPMKLGNQYQNKALGMAIALEDETVPTMTQVQLKNFWKPTKVVNYTSGHFWGIIKTWWYDEDIVYDFFEEHLSKK